MSTSTGAKRAHATDRDVLNGRGPVRRSTETKASFKTTEFFAYVGIVIAILIAAAVNDAEDALGFGARQAWLYVTILTVGYMVSRGLAKSGSRDPYTDDDR
jgi:fucose permease